jgi:hypothetical protein
MGAGMQSWRLVLGVIYCIFKLLCKRFNLK